MQFKKSPLLVFRIFSIFSVLFIFQFAHSSSDFSLVKTMGLPQSQWADSSGGVVFKYGMVHRQWRYNYRMDELQNIKDRLNDFAGKIHLQMVKNGSLATVPNIEVIASKDPSAFVTVLRVCVPIEVEVSGGETNGEPSLEIDYLHIHNNGASYATPPVFRGGDPCVKASWFDPNQIDMAVAHVNSQNTKCQIRKVGQSYQLDSSNGCEIGLGYDKKSGRRGPIAKAQQIVVESTASSIVVSSGFIARMNSEAELLSVVGHELGHYYQAHPMRHLNDVYWYKNQTPSQKKYDRVKLPDHFVEFWKDNVFPYGSDAEKDKLPNMNPVTAFFNLRVLPDLITQSCTGENSKFICDQSCRNMSDNLSDKKFTWFSDLNNFNPLTDSQWAELSDFAGQVLTCSQHISLQHESVLDPNGNIIFDKLVNKEIPVEFLVSNFADFIETHPLQIDRSQKTLADAIKVVEQLGEKIVANRQSIEEQVIMEQYVRRSVEVDADEISLLLNSLGGISVAAAMDSHIHFLEEGSEERGVCEELRKTDFKVSGVDQFIPQGLHMIHRPHPSHCFRAWYLYRQQQAHNFVVKDPWAPMAGSDWKRYQELAAEISQEYSTIPRPAFGSQKPDLVITPAPPENEGLIVDSY